MSGLEFLFLSSQSCFILSFLSETKIVSTSNETKKKSWKEKQNQRHMGHNAHLSVQL